MARDVALLMGGWSAEREISLITGAACASALESAGYAVKLIDVQPDIGGLLARLQPRPDVIFNALHGRFGEDGCIQGLLDMLNIPYTHSGLMASAIAMNKPRAKHIFATAGISVAEEMIVARQDTIAGDPMPRPYVIKPVNEGSSVGVRIVRDGDNHGVFGQSHGEDAGCKWSDKVMIERFIAGRELTVAVMGKDADARGMTVTDIITQRGFYDYDAKYADGGSQHVLPADLPRAVFDEAIRLAESAHQVLGCRGVSRADMRYDGETIYMLEINTQPGMTPTSLVPEQAAAIGMSFEDLVSWMVENAECGG